MLKLKNNFIKILACVCLAAFLFSPAISKASGESRVQIILGIKPGVDLSALAHQYNLQNFQKLYTGNQLANVYTADTTSDEQVLLGSDFRINFAENDSAVSVAQLSVSQVVTTNDPFFTTDPSQQDKQWYLPKIRAPEAWNYTHGSASVVVAIVDTGIHSSHLDLNDGRVVAGFDMTTGEIIPANSDSDDNGHGTAVAGVIGAIPNNQKGISGINWVVSMMPVKVLNSEGKGDISVIAEGIMWAADHGADVINLSLGGSGFPNSSDLANAVSYAYSKGSLVIAAAGNDKADQGLNLDQNPVYPVCEDNGQNMVLGVAASDISDRKSDFSNFGINCVDITAPGQEILTTAFFPSDPSDNVLIYASGTSLATPVVAGVAALIKSENPSMTNAQIRDLILNTADNIDALNQDNCLGSSCNGFLGKGRIDALSALQPQPILNNTLVRETATNNIYLVSGGIKHYVSQFVLNQKYPGAQILIEQSGQLDNYTLGDPVAPNTGTLIKSETDPTVYYIDNGVRRPLTYLVFVSRNFSFANVKIMSESDLASIPLADWYWPPDGTLVLIKGNPTVYVMSNQVARPVTYYVFTQRKLSFAKVISVTTDEFSHVPRPQDSFWLSPLDGTLVKSVSDPTVYVIENSTKRALSAAAFAERKYSFSSIVSLPQAEMDVIMPGTPIL
ncbi:MAG TPA: S8 family peptidase [Patescibacteria group bacterium]|nr:S8 family peptidase [Patescibacteria group bacterium]